MDNAEKTNTFIATLPRSGSTLLGMMLDQHPKVYHAGETFFWGRLLPKNIRCSCSNHPCPILTSVYESIRDHPQELELLFKTCSMLARTSRAENASLTFSVAGFDDHYPESEWLKLDHYVDLACDTLETLSFQYRRILGKSIIVDNSKVIELARALLTRRDWRVILLTREA
jgi:hypothetical protein